MITVAKITAHPVQQTVDNSLPGPVGLPILPITNPGFNPSGIIAGLKGAAKAAADAYNKAEKWAAGHPIVATGITAAMPKIWAALVNAYKQYGPEVGNAIESGVNAAENLPPVAHPVGSEAALSPVQQAANNIIAMAGPFAQMLPTILSDAQTAAAYETGSLVDVTG